MSPAGCSTTARTKRPDSSPGRPSPLLEAIPVLRGAGDPSPTHDTLAGARVVDSRATEEAPATREAMGKGNRSRGRWRQGVGGLQRSDDVGERDYPRTRLSTGGPCRCDLQERTMSNALTWEAMSPGLLKVVEMRSREPHRRKSRMVAISLSGSGEGPGWATSRPTLQRPLPPPASALSPCRLPAPTPRSRTAAGSRRTALPGTDRTEAWGRAAGAVGAAGCRGCG